MKLIIVISLKNRMTVIGQFQFLITDVIKSD